MSYGNYRDIASQDEKRRAYALELATQHHFSDATRDEVVATARKFEDYLMGADTADIAVLPTGPFE